MNTRQAKKKRSHSLLPMGLHTYTTYMLVLFVVYYKNASQLSDVKSNTIGYYNTTYTIVHHRWRPIVRKRSVFERCLSAFCYLSLYLLVRTETVRISDITQYTRLLPISPKYYCSSTINAGYFYNNI